MADRTIVFQGTDHTEPAMHATLCFHLPDQPALLRIVATDNAPILIGRSEENTIVVPHVSVSRVHASLDHDGENWWVQDMKSTNGIRIGGHAVTRQRMLHRDWFSLGDVFCEFRVAREEDLQAYATRAEQRRQTSGMWLGRLEQALDRDSLLAGLTAAIVELAECRRGFILSGDLDRGLSTVACSGIAAQHASDREFRGSSGAIIRAIHGGEPVLLNDPSTVDWASGRRSIVAAGLKSLVALPILHRGRLLGVAYADSDMPGKVFTQLDAEILGAFAEQAAVLLAARGIDDLLAKLESCIQADAAGNPVGEFASPRWVTLA